MSDGKTFHGNWTARACATWTTGGTRAAGAGAGAVLETLLLNEAAGLRTSTSFLTQAFLVMTGLVELV